MVFIDPSREGGIYYNQWKNLGIGGFYIITGVEHMVLSDDVLHETIVRAKWVTFGDCGSSQNGATIKTPLPVRNSFPGTVPEEFNARVTSATPMYRPQPG